MEADIASRRYPQMIRIRVPAGLPAAVEIAARRALTSPAEWMCRTLLTELEAADIRLDAEGRIATPATPTQPPTSKGSRSDADRPRENA